PGRLLCGTSKPPRVDGEGQPFISASPNRKVHRAAGAADPNGGTRPDTLRRRIVQCRRFKSKSGTRIIELLVPLAVPKFVLSLLQWVTNFGSGGTSAARPTPRSGRGSGSVRPTTTTRCNAP